MNTIPPGVDAHEGIEHYSDCMTRAAFFDEALSQYFQQNGWGLQQFSVLRPLSEMLILKILVNRYPDLQMHQVSCHASHKEGERVHFAANAKNAAGLWHARRVWRRSAALRLFTRANQPLPQRSQNQRRASGIGRCTTPALAAHPARAFDAAAARTGIAEIASEHYEIALSPGSLAGGPAAKRFAQTFV
ncbi:MAG: hypothetical protein R3C26_10865 [Calditrichia bacterium]